MIPVLLIISDVGNRIATVDSVPHKDELVVLDHEGERYGPGDRVTVSGTYRVEEVIWYASLGTGDHLQRKTRVTIRLERVSP